MKNKFFLKIIPFTIIGLLSLVPFLQASEIVIYPHFGLSKPVGETDDLWQPGFVTGVEGITNLSNSWHWGLGLNFHRWKVNSQCRLGLDGKKMSIEDEEGNNNIGELNIFARYSLTQLESQKLSYSFDGGLGLFYLRSSKINLKGYYVSGETIVNNEFHQPENKEFAPGIIIGFNLLFKNRFQPSLRYKHIFTKNTETSIFLASLGVYARK